MGVANTDLAKQLGSSQMGARMWRLVPGQASTRQIFNDTNRDALWLVVGAPPELANTKEMSEAQLAQLYPDGPQALPPELEAER